MKADNLSEAEIKWSRNEVNQNVTCLQWNSWFPPLKPVLTVTGYHSAKLSDKSANKPLPTLH